MVPLKVRYLSAHDQPRGLSARTHDFSRELVGRGHRVTLFTNSYCHWTHVERLGPHEKWRIEDVDGVRVVWLRTIPYVGNGWRRGANMLSNAWRAISVAPTLAEKPDVVIAPSVPLGTGWAGAHIARRTGAAFVFEVRDVWPIALVYDGGLSRWSPAYFGFRAIEKHLYRAAHRISATMPLLRRHVVESGSDPEKVRWIPNGVDLARFQGLQDYDGGRVLPLTVMYVGGFGVAHDVMTIVRSATRLQEQNERRLRFVIIGNGPKRPECERAATAAGLRNVEFRDPVPKADVPRVQSESDILVACVTDSPSYRFGLNLNKLFDYFASSRPVVFSGSAPNDPIRESGCGFTVPPEQPAAMADALQKIADMTPEERRALGARGRAYVEREFDMRSLGGRMEAMLLEAVAERAAEGVIAGSSDGASSR